MTGEFGPLEGILQPENSRHWFETVSDEDAWLMQIAGFPKGKAKAKRIAVGKDRPDGQGGVKFNMARQAGK